MRAKAIAASALPVATLAGSFRPEFLLLVQPLEVVVKGALCGTKKSPGVFGAPGL